MEVAGHLEGKAVTDEQETRDTVVLIHGLWMTARSWLSCASNAARADLAFASSALASVISLSSSGEPPGVENRPCLVRYCSTAFSAF